jgi:hypothetical protein
MTGAEILKAEAARLATLSPEEQDREMMMQASRCRELQRRDALMELPALRIDKPKRDWGEIGEEEISVGKRKSRSLDSFSPLMPPLIVG